MTTAATEQIVPGAVQWAPFGQHTRYMLAQYLAHVLLVASVLLAIALTIDLWPQFEIVMNRQGGAGPLAAIWNVVEFSALRTPWLIAPFLSFATFLGVLWTEVIHTRSGERMLIWNSGRSPLQCLAPVLLLGLILGSTEFVLDAYLGPASMAVQMKERWGLDGQRLDRTRWSVPSWIALPDGLLRAEIEFGPPSVLHNVAYFRRDAHGSLLEAETAAVARRRPGTNLWVLQNGHTWNSGQRPSGEQPALAIASSNEQMLPFATRTVRLDIDPLWLTIYGLEAQYISLGTLQALVHSDRDLESVRRYRARLNVLYGETILPGTMGLLAASLSMVFLAYGVTMRSLVGIGFTGYMAHFATKACLLMGQTGYMRPRVAGWSVPIILLVATAAVLAIAQRRRRREKISGA